VRIWEVLVPVQGVSFQVKSFQFFLKKIPRFRTPITIQNPVKSGKVGNIVREIVKFTLLPFSVQ
jgi:hypothetical protein